MAGANYENCTPANFDEILLSQNCRRLSVAHQYLGFECSDNPDDILPANRALRHLFSTVGAGAHVTALEHHAVNRGIHAYFTDGVVVHGVQLLLASTILLPKAFNNLQKFFLLHAPLEVHPVHGEDLFRLLCAELLEVGGGLDLGQVDHTLVGESSGAGRDGPTSLNIGK